MSVLALHGFTGVGADFAPFAELCGMDQWHCPNLPGHGPESKLDCTPEATIKQINVEATLLSLSSAPLGTESDKSVASTKRVLLGYSLGARAALLHACQKPFKWDALILISPNPGIEEEASRVERRAVDEKLAQRIEDEGVASFIEFWQNTPMIRSQKKIRPEWLEMMQANRQQHSTTGLANSLRQFGQGVCPNLWPELNKLTMPVLLLTGAEDTKYTRIAERMVEKLDPVRSASGHVASLGTTSSRRSHAKPDPNSSLPTHIVIDEVGHMPHLEKPTETAGTINSFLGRIK